MSSFDVLTFPVVVANSRLRIACAKNQSRTGEYVYRGKTELARSHVDSKAPDAKTHHYFKVSKIQKLTLPKIVEPDRTEEPNAPVAPEARDAQKKIGLIERENKTLSTRLATIYRGPGLVDCWNEYQKKSSRRQKQNIELVKITVENQGILKRIRERKPTYDRRQSEIDWEDLFEAKKVNPLPGKKRVSLACKDACPDSFVGGIKISPKKSRERRFLDVNKPPTGRRES